MSEVPNVPMRDPSDAESSLLRATTEIWLVREGHRDTSTAASADVRASSESLPLLRARQARRLKLDDLVTGLVEKLDLPEDARATVRRNYEDLELGRLDPAGVAASVWAALAGLLGRDAEGLAVSPPLAAGAATEYRAADFDKALDHGVLLLRRPGTEAEPDEVDRLFGVTFVG